MPSKSSEVKLSGLLINFFIFMGVLFVEIYIY